MCKIRSGLDAGRQHGNLVPAQREPVALDDRRVAEDAGTDDGGCPEHGTWTHSHIGATLRSVAGPGPPGKAGSGRISVMSELKERIRADLTASMKDRDEVKTRTLRMVLTEISKEEVSGDTARELDDAEIERVLAREAKRRREAAEAFDGAGRSDQAAAELAEGKVLADVPAGPA